MSQQMPPPGWYPDPAGPGRRYWDGGRWTEQTQATPPAPVAAGPVAGPALTPAYGAVPPPPPGAHATTTPSSGSANAGAAFAGFVDQLKKLEPFALVVVGFVVLVISTFLPWLKSSSRGPGGSGSDSINGWSDEGPWLIRGYDVDEAIQSLTIQAVPKGGTDLIILLPLAIIVAGVVVLAAQGKKITYGAEIAAGAAGLLTLLLILEITHIGSWFGDLQDEIAQQFPGVTIEGSAGFGLWLAVIAAALMTFGAVRALLAHRSR